MNKFFKVSQLMVLSGFVMGCTSTIESQVEPRVISVKPSILAEKSEVEPSAGLQGNQGGQSETLSGFQRLQSVMSDRVNFRKQFENSKFAADNNSYTLAAESMPARELIHYALGDVLGVNYVMSEDVKADNTPLTLNISSPLSAQDVFSLLAETLGRHQITIDFDNDIFFFQKAQLSKAKAVIGIGNSIDSIPNTASQILQVIPIKYGIKLTLERTIRELIDANVTVDFEQSAIFIMGDRANVIRAIELIQLLDVPANRGKFIGLMSLTYIDTESFLTDVRTLLNSEGIASGVGNELNRNVLLVPIRHIGAIAVFASHEDLLERVRYWADIMDKPTEGENEQYFIYTPKYARAADIGESIGQLLTIGRPSTSQPASSASTGSNADKLETGGGSGVVNSAQVSFVVDERSNTLIFSTTGTQYQTLLPLLDRLDILPKQILLEVMIAEVTLTDGFKFGVEFALRNRGNSTISTLGAFGAEAAGGLNFSFLDSDTEATASFFRENQLVNILSNPTMLVRDGVGASISVGTSIPIQSGVSVDDGVQTTSVEYRKTGVEVQVTPTVNAQGVVIMTISQSISNTVDSNTASNGNPSIFERTLDTEAVVSSGQTVILGGLISEDSSRGQTKVPILGDIPLIGNAFRGQNDSISKTELVMLVTPKVIHSNDEWEKILNDFENGLQNLTFQ